MEKKTTLLVTIDIDEHDRKKCKGAVCSFYIVEPEDYDYCALFLETTENFMRCESCLREFGE